MSEITERKPAVSVVVLSYDRPALLREALESVAAQSYAPSEVIVVDNASPSSAEVARVVAEFGGASLVRSASNEGYAGGMNRGIERAAGEYVFLTEDDIVLGRQCLRQLVEHAADDPSAGLVAPLIYNRGAGTIRCAGGEFELGGVYRRRTYGEGERDRGQYARPFDVSYVDGAAFLARASFLRGLGGFREEFFMYVEMVELCARALRAGRRLTVVPAARVEHFEPAPGANASPLFAFHRHKNLFALYLLHAPARHLPEFFCRYAVLGCLRAAAARGGPGAGPLVRALWWAAKRAPALLGERRRAAAGETAGTKEAATTTSPQPTLFR